jgi:hypothetical protein
VVTPLLVLVAVLAVAAGVVAVAAPSPRVATVGAFAAVLLGALVMDPLPSPAAIVAWLAASVLGGWLVWVALRGGPAATARTSLGWFGAAALAAAAFAIGWLAASAFGQVIATGVGDGLVADVSGATLASGSLVARAGVAAAAALAVLAAAPVVLPRDGHRLGLGVVLLIAAASLLADALGATTDNALELAFALLVALTGAAIAGVSAAMLRGGGDLVLRETLTREPAARHRAADDAHRGPGR